MARYPKQSATVGFLLVAVSTVVILGANPQVATGQSATAISSYFTLTSTSTLLSSPFRIDGAKVSERCAFRSQSFYVPGSQPDQYLSHQIVSGFITSKTPISFYLVPDVNYGNWVNNGGLCSPNFWPPYGALISLEGITTSPFSVQTVWVGKYWLVFVNFLSVPVDVNVELELVWPFYAASTTMRSQPNASTVQSSPTTSVLTSSGPEIIGFIPFSNIGLFGIGTLVVVIASVVVIARMRKVSPEPELKQKTPDSVQVFRRAVTPSQPIISTGYADLDGTLAGGVPEGFAIVVVSPAYDERDLLLRKIIESALSSGRPAFYISRFHGYSYFESLNNDEGRDSNRN